MSLFGSILTSSSGLSAQRLRLDVISDNLANASTTRTAEGGPFQRSRVIFRPIVSQPYWRSPFLPEGLDNGLGKGVRVSKTEKDNSPPVLKYDPTHPDRGQRDGRHDRCLPGLRGQRDTDQRRQSHVLQSSGNRTVV